MMMEGLGIGRCPPLCETIGGRPVGPTAREVLGANKDPPSTSTRALGAGALRWENGHKEVVWRMTLNGLPQFLRVGADEGWQQR